jgi:hypothetical protein
VTSSGRLQAIAGIENSTNAQDMIVPYLPTLDKKDWYAPSSSGIIFPMLPVQGQEDEQWLFCVYWVPLLPYLMPNMTQLDYCCTTGTGQCPSIVAAVPYTS